MSTKQNDETQARWYMVNKDGMATLCADKADAEKEANDAQEVWPHMGPHRAVQLVEVSQAFTAADMATAAAQGFRDGQSAQPAVAAGWVSVEERLPPCRDDQEYIGINSAGFAGIFNAVSDIAGTVYCMMETAEEFVSIMSDLSIWKPFTRPLPPSSAKGVAHG